MANPVTWFEITGKNGDKLREFYKNAFGWQMEVAPGMDYGMVDNKGEGIGGGIGQGDQTQVTFYIEVDDPQAYLDKIEAKGGKTVVPVTEIPDMVTFAQFADPQGNVVGLVKTNPQT
jgi:predicted enzyme related to lactoylglutathione lyase